MFLNLSANEEKAEFTGDLKRSELRMYQLFEKYFSECCPIKNKSFFKVHGKHYTWFFWTALIRRVC